LRQYFKEKIKMQGGHVWKNQKQLRLGYTTGSCAAAAAKAAAYMLLSGQTLTQVSLLTPKGITLYLDVEYIEKSQGQVSCAIQKDSGDDPDITDGVYVYATVKHSAGTGLSLGGGEGVGRVTKKGLEQEIGAAAINKVPRHMILEAVEEQRAQFDCKEGLEILISIPEGQKLAVKTFNPRLGIEGGISVLGTSGIVEPMSEKALTDTIYLEMKFLKENGHDWCYIVPGNYGSDFLTETLGYNGALAVKCSNYIGETIDAAVSLGMKGILFIGHAGKLIKLAAGVMNTHSRQADCRMEVLSSHAAMKGASGAEVERIMNCTTTTEAIEFLKELGILDIAMESIVSRIDFYLKQRAGSELKIGAIMFSKEEGILCETSDTEKLLEQIGKEKL
jgi:cobalt-precorrin-5B (C1)-methyltransferase